MIPKHIIDEICDNCGEVLSVNVDENVYDEDSCTQFCCDDCCESYHSNMDILDYDDDDDGDGVI